jgi:spermidine synthase
MAMTTLATLLLELSLTRIFSVVFYYHFAFLAISIALFGLGAGGVFSYLVAGWKGSLFGKLGWLALANSVTAVLSLLYLLTREGKPDDWTLALVYFASALPFFFSGAIISLAISETVERVDRVYFFDLLGAAGGCLALIPLLNSFGGPNTVICSAVLFAVSASIWLNLAGKRMMRAAGVAAALLLVGLVVVNAKRPVLDIRWAKGQAISGEVFVKWNSFSRIGMRKEAGSDIMMIVIDADASTAIANFDFANLSERDRHVLTAQGPSFPYLARPGAKALIIGPGGGYDVARALANGSKDVTGVEINPIIANTIMRERFPYLSRGLYHRPEVKLHVEDGRSFVRRSKEKYQVMQMTLVDTWASTAAGAFALSENNLYTTDAFRDYLNHLTDDGIMAFTRWGFEPPRESVRLLALAREALAELGEHRPASHVIVVRENTPNIDGWGALDTVLVARKPFPRDAVDKLRVQAQTNGLDLVYFPGDGPGNAFGKLLLAKDPDEFLAGYPYDVSPVDDNRPFFFYTVQTQELWRFLTSASRETADYKINRAVPLLFALVGTSLLATLIVLALPPAILGTRLPREKGVPRLLMYFVCIGAGYILIQVALIQKFVLFLSHPTYALTVIIFSMLVFSGLGSFFSRRLVGDSDARLKGMLLFVAVFVAVLAVAAAPLTAKLIGWPLPVKMLVTSLAIAPAAFAMGMPFPMGLARLEAYHRPSVRWAWSLNAASSVLGSAGSIFLAIYLGLREAMLIGGVLYLCAWLVIRGARRPLVAI